MTTPPPAAEAPLAVFVRPGSFPITRVVRNLRVAEARGYRTLYLGAARDAALPRKDRWEGFAIERVGIAYALLGGRKAWLYLAGVLSFALAANWRLFRLRPAIVHASDVEGMLGCLLYRLLFRRSRLLFNVHDNMHQRYACPAWMKSLMRTFEGVVARFADDIILPDERRVAALSPLAIQPPVLVPNTPEDPGTPSPMPSGPTRLLLVGWLDWRRGVETARQLLDRTVDLELVVAGDGPPDVIAAIRSLPRTTYHGFVAHEEVFRLADGCHAFLALYDPVSEINRNASPNKVGDALALGRPTVINSEVAVAAELDAAGAALSVPYHDIDALAEAVATRLGNAVSRERMSRAARAHYVAAYDWALFQPRVEALFPAVGEVPDETATTDPLRVAA